MGGIASRLQPAAGPVDYFAVTLREPDKLIVSAAPPDGLDVVKNVLLREADDAYPVKKHGPNDTDGYTFKMVGSPFRRNTFGSDDAAKMRLVFCNLFSELSAGGWEVAAASDLAQVYSNSTVLFRRRRRRCSPQQTAAADDGAARRKFLCVSPSSTDKLMLLNVPKKFAQQMVQKVESLWKLQEKESLGGGEDEANFCLKMKGNPWGIDWSTNAQEAAAKIRYFLLEIFRFLRSHNFTMRANVNFKGTADSMFFEYDPSLDKNTEDLFIMYMSKNDRIRLLHSPAYMVDETRAVIEEQWPTDPKEPGLQSERFDSANSAHEFQLHGSPWWAHGEAAMASRRLMTGLLAAFQAKGWDVAAALDISRRLNDKTVWVFRQGPPISAPWMCLSFHETDKLRLTADERDADALRDVVGRHLATGLSESIISRERSYGPSHEWKLQGTPFRGSLFGADQIVVTNLLLRILQDVERRGWRLAASADISSKYVRTEHTAYPLDVHSWFFALDAEAGGGAGGGASAAAGT